jgi:hypothetical protein
VNTQISQAHILDKMPLFERKISISLLITFTLLTGCSESLQQRLAADPNLQEQEENTTTTPTPSSEEPTNSDSSDASNPSNPPTDNTNRTTPETTEEPTAEVPETIPVYPNAELVGQETNAEASSGTLELTTTDERAEIANFYEQALKQENWEIVTPFTREATAGEQVLRAKSSSLALQVTLFEETEDAATQRLLIEYQPLADTRPTAEPPQPEESEDSTQTSASRTFTDLEQTPDPLAPYVRDVAQLGILTPIANDNQSGKQFAPNQAMTRRTFARWLFKANNRFYRDRASQQIRPVQQAQTPAFTDIPPSDPDFAIIQGLAEAGLIPSRLTGDTTVTRFRPDAPLTRETLFLWKVPLDTRSNLPAADVNTVKETWGFQDASKIDPKALGAIVADFSNGEQSTLRRVYGYTQLLQPEKAATRAEAAAALWSFGTQGEIVTAKELTQD